MIRSGEPPSARSIPASPRPKQLPKRSATAQAPGEGVIYRSRKDSCRPRKLSFGFDLFTLCKFRHHTVSKVKMKGKKAIASKFPTVSRLSFYNHGICLYLAMLRPGSRRLCKRMKRLEKSPRERPSSSVRLPSALGVAPN